MQAAETNVTRYYFRQIHFVEIAFDCYIIVLEFCSNLRPTKNTCLHSHFCENCIMNTYSIQNKIHLCTTAVSRSAVLKTTCDSRLY